MNHFDQLKATDAYRTFAILSGDGKTVITELLVPHGSFKERNVELRSNNCRLAVR